MATIYKEGSADRDMVRRIQETVGVAADGVWGPKTTAAVKAWQKAHSLKDDGVVGPATAARMGLSESVVKDWQGIRITKGYINTHISFSIGRPLKYIAIHYTAGRTSNAGAAMANRNVFLTRQASADFVVDDEQIVQVNPDIRNYYCWAVGDKKNPYSGGGRLHGVAMNKNTISIEMCSSLKPGTSATMANHEGWYFTDQVVDNTRNLVRYLMKRYGIPKENVVRHYDVSGKLCPGVPGWNHAPLYTKSGKETTMKNNSEKWQAFLASI